MPRGRGVQNLHETGLPKDAVPLRGSEVYTLAKRLRMDKKFHLAIIRELAAGTEHCTVGVSTVACTKFPIVNYVRDDHIFPFA
jgi:hypothetical protein